MPSLKCRVSAAKDRLTAEAPGPAHTGWHHSIKMENTSNPHQSALCSALHTLTSLTIQFYKQLSSINLLPQKKKKIVLKTHTVTSGISDQLYALCSFSKQLNLCMEYSMKFQYESFSQNTNIGYL